MGTTNLDTLALAENITVAGTVAVTGATSLAAVASTGEIKGASLAVPVPGETTAGLMKTYVTDVTTTLAANATTNITLALPAGAAILGVALKVTTAIGGVNSTSGTLTLTGGSTSVVGGITTMTAGSGSAYAAPLGPLTDVTQATFVLSGGADNTPSSGAVRVVVHYYTMAAI